MKRIDRLLADMTLEEKLGQLTMVATGAAVTGPTSTSAVAEQVRAGGVGHVLNLVGRPAISELQRTALEHSRLGVPLLFGLDILHGYHTLFPIPLAEAGTFDADLWQWTARTAAREAVADGLAMTFAPMLDVARDPRWGRCAEGPGEDPWLAAAMARAKVQGFQHAGSGKPLALAAVAKHFLAYGAATAGRDYASAEVSERTVREVYAPPFAAAVEAGVAAIMPAFHDLGGEPMTSSERLIRGLLRARLGFDGVIVSDYHAIAELIDHGVAVDLIEAAALALNAGVDIDMMSDAFRAGLPEALARGRVRMEQIEAAVRRVLVLKERLGLFEDPYREHVLARSGAAGGSSGGGDTPAAATTPVEVRAGARQVATRSLVLLKNGRDVLPLQAAALRTLAVLGPLADARREMRGPWWGAAEPDDAVTVLEGMRRALPASEVLTAAGVSLDGALREDLPAALEAAERADAVVLCLGEGTEMSGEAASRATPDLPGEQGAFASAVLERTARRGTPVIFVLFSGRPLLLGGFIERADAVLAAWFPGCEAGNAIADVLTGRSSPTGRTVMSWPRAAGQIPIFFGQRRGGRPTQAGERFTSRYLDLPAEPLFPFGHGLGFGCCRLERLRVSAPTLRREESLEVAVEVVHERGRAIEETLFLFVRDPVASVARPALELRGFGKIHLAPGESGTVTFTLRGRELCFLGPDLEPVYEAGTLEVLVGPCADASRLLATRIELIT
ncbi:MAG TPA: glycoside hydrolase family 3 N-terminal domain-containing protein [Steroidobacteraceae bacterium]|nr:glycoside hydrolase family 3 N-terminal domain-containing protein [Steroidobacteraceae bacterium]